MQINCILCFVLLEPKMHDLIKIVIPKVSSEWDNIAYALWYDVQTVKLIKNNNSGDIKKCCKELFIDWLSTSNGAKPKIWKTLLGRLIEVEDLVSATEEIIEKLIQMDSHH